MHLVNPDKNPVHPVPPVQALTNTCATDQSGVSTTIRPVSHHISFTIKTPAITNQSLPSHRTPF